MQASCLLLPRSRAACSAALFCKQSAALPLWKLLNLVDRVKCAHADCAPQVRSCKQLEEVLRRGPQAMLRQLYNEYLLRRLDSRQRGTGGGGGRGAGGDASADGGPGGRRGRGRFGRGGRQPGGDRWAP